MSRGLVKRLLLALSAPPLFLLLVETLFAVTGAFAPVRYLLDEERGGVHYLRSNPAYGTLFLPRRDVPMPSPVWVRRDRTPGVIRVALLGESAAAGFPHPEYNLARCLEQVWRIVHPDRPIEVVNLTMVGVNSHLLRRMAREAQALKPDAMILFAGHNEAIGPYGPGSVFGRYSASLPVIRFSLWARNTRTGRAAAAIHAWWITRRQGALPPWQGLEEFRESPLSADDPRIPRMAAHAAANLRAMVADAHAAGIKVLAAIPPFNLTDWPPLASEPETHADADALAAWDAGDRSGLPSAYQAYRLARQHAQGGDWDSAWPLYRWAADRDLYRFRLDARVADAIRSLPRAGLPVHVLDLDRQLHEGNPIFLTDRDYFCEHVHLTFAGRVWVAAQLAVELGPLLQPGNTTQAIPPVTMAEMAGRLMFTPLDEAAVWQDVRLLLSLGVFARQPEREERDAFLRETYIGLRREFAAWSPEQVLNRYQDAREKSPDDLLLDLIAGRLLMEMGSNQQAIPLLRKGLERFPNYHQGWLDLARVAMGTGAMAEAGVALQQAERYSFDHPRLPALRGEYHARKGDWPEARQHLEKAVANRPDNFQVLVNLANVCLMQGDTVCAYEMFTRSLNINPEDPGVCNNFAWLLVTRPAATPEDARRALALVDTAVRLKPDHPSYRATQVLVWAALGRTNDVNAAAPKVIDRLKRPDGDAGLVEELRRHLANRGWQDPSRRDH